MAKRLPIYLQQGEASRHEAGRFRFVSLLAKATARLGYAPEIMEASPLITLIVNKDDEKPSLWHQMRPIGLGGHVFRTAYRPPFWRIERDYERWRWDVAESVFDAEQVDPEEAKRFCDRLRAEVGVRPSSAHRSAILVPLQAELLQKRRFQSASPAAMLETVCERSSAADTVIATLHPKARYSDEERVALEQLVEKWPRLTTESGPTEPLLETARLLVSQNSTVTIAGYLAGTPAVLYAKSEFHHIARDPTETDAFEHRNENQASFDRYVFWLLTIHAIRAGRHDVVDQIVSRLRALGF